MSAYPVRVRGHLDEPLSRGLWLVKGYWHSPTTLFWDCCGSPSPS